MNTGQRPAQTVPHCYRSLTPSEFASSADRQPDSLHRSELVYRCCDFNQSVAASGSLPFPACLPQPFAERPTVWRPKESVPAFSQRDSQHCCTSLQADLPIKKAIDLSTFWQRCFPTPPVMMQDLYQPPSYRQQCESESRAQPNYSLTDADWLNSFPGSHDYGQPKAFTVAESQNLYCETPLELEQPVIEGQMIGLAPDSLWDFQAQVFHEQPPNPQHPPGRSKTQVLSDSHAVSPLPIHGLESHAFPLTPPSSTRSEGASPPGDVVDSHHHVKNNTSQVLLDATSNHSSVPTIPTMKFPVPSVSQQVSPEIVWSNEDFVQFLDTDPFLPKSDSFDNGYAENPMPNSGWDYQSSASFQATGQQKRQSQQGEWLDARSIQPIYSNVYASLPINAFDQINPAPVTMPSYNLDTRDHSLQPENSTVSSSMFESLSPDISTSPARRRTSIKSHQRATARDRELIEWKNQGLSYKEIKARGGFDEAESTLRGRYRTLTKPKHLRVRKPEWQPKDVEILLEAVDRHLKHHVEEQNAVERYSTEGQRKAAKVPWKQVAEYMEKRGCYRYGNATVKKKYLKVMDDPLNL